MTDIEISKQLALAIGWPIVEENNADHCVVRLDDECWIWQVFDYRDWNVIGPIAERYECFPQVVGDDSVGKAWRCDWADEADTPQKAIALAVIGAAKP